MKKTGWMESMAPVVKDLHWLKVGERIKFKILLLTFKALRGEAPVYLSELLIKPDTSHSLRSLISPNDLYVPKYNLTFMGLTTFKAAAPRQWNALPEHIKTAESVVSFKKLLKTHLFKQSFN